MNVAILGLGRFGSQLARELGRLGVDVLAVDHDSAIVNTMVETVLLAADGNVEDVEFLESLSLHNYDSVVIAIGSNVATSVLVTLTPQTTAAARSRGRQSELERAHAGA